MPSPFGPSVTQWRNAEEIVAWMRASGGCQAGLFRLEHREVGQLHALLPHCRVVIWRQLKSGENAIVDEDLANTFAEPRRYVEQAVETLTAAGIDARAVYLHLHNEPGFHEATLKWEADAIEYGAALGLKFCALNLSVGVPETAAIPKAQRLLELIDTYHDQVVLGLHLYFPLLAGRKAQWYHGRYGEIFDFCDRQSIRRPRIIATEAGTEGIADDRRSDPAWYAKLGYPDGEHPTGMWSAERGWQALYGALGKPYRGPEEAHAEQMIEAWETVWQGEVEAVLPFTWNGHWPAYDWREARIFKQRLADYGKEHPIVTMFYPPSPNDPEWTWGVITEMSAAPHLNLRAQNDAVSADLGDIVPGDVGKIVRYVDKAEYGDWLALHLETHSGAIATGFAHKRYLKVKAQRRDVPGEDDPRWKPALIANVTGTTTLYAQPAALVGVRTISDADEGKTIRVMQFDDLKDWAVVRFEGAAGFVLASDLQTGPAEPPKPEPSATEAVLARFDETEQKVLRYALVYAADPSFPEPSANLKKLIGKLFAVAVEMAESGSAGQQVSRSA